MLPRWAAVTQACPSGGTRSESDLPSTKHYQKKLKKQVGTQVCEPGLQQTLKAARERLFSSLYR